MNKMKTENTIFEVDGGYKLENDNAQSVETYLTYEDATIANKTDMEAWENTSDAMEALDLSPVEWE